MIDDVRPRGGRRQAAPHRPINTSASRPLAVPRQQTNAADNTFRTPEQVADTDSLQQQPYDQSPSPLIPDKNPAGTKSGWRARIHWPRSKKQWLLFGVVLALLAGGGVSAYVLFRPHAAPPPPKPAPAVQKPAPPKPTTVASTLTGLQVSPEVNQRPVTGIMIENSLDARPQSGLAEAGVVFEAIAEGGITRFLALYQDTQPDYIGPVRSARPYYLMWALGFDAAYAHVGGSPEALQYIKSWGVKDLDQFYNSGAYWRVSQRYAPHNVYTSIAKLNEVESAKGYTSSTYTGFVRKTEAPAKQPNATSINLNFSGYSYNTHYDYDSATNSYKRSEAGQPHLSVNAAGTQTQISPKVVVALIVPYTLEADGYHSNYQAVGSGHMYVFQDGTVQEGTWSKPSNNSQLVFTDANGKSLGLNPGQTWVGALADTSKVNYQ